MLCGDRCQSCRRCAKPSDEADEVSTHHSSEEYVWVAVLWLLDHWSYACHTESPVATRRRSSIDAETSEDPSVSAAGDDLFIAQESIDLLCHRLACWSAAIDVEPVDVLVTICARKLAKAHKHTAYEGFRSAAVGPLACEWCQSYQVTVTASFALNTYSEQDARNLAQLWCHCLQSLDNVVVENSRRRLTAIRSRSVCMVSLHMLLLLRKERPKLCSPASIICELCSSACCQRQQ